MNSTELERLLRELRVTTGAGLDERIVADASAALEQTRTDPLGAVRPSGWRGIMRSHWTKLTTIAAAIAIAVVSLTIFNRSAVPVYAIEQTLEANRAVRHVHVLITPPGKGVSEAWGQFDEQGQPVQLRLEFPDTEDGPKTTIWRAEGKAEVWFHRKNIHLIANEPKTVGTFRQIFELFDPRLGFESAYAAQAAGKANVSVQTPADPQAPIVLVVAQVPASDRKEIYTIDRVSKRVLKMEKYRVTEAGDQFVSRFDYEYDQEPAPDLFVLNPPANVMKIDQTAQDIGVPRDGLSDEELAVKVAREFFEALIAGDYDKAGRIYEGIPGDKLREAFGNVKFLRIVSIGSPTPHPIPATKFLCVPCEIEVQAGGQTAVQKFTPNIRHAYNQPDRFIIGGGI